jgi:hypothetical protein
MLDNSRDVVVTDIKIPFWSMVVLMVKWALAAIPAFVILFALGMAVTAALGFLFGWTFDHWWRWGPGRIL